MSGDQQSRDQHSLDELTRSMEKVAQHVQEDGVKDIGDFIQKQLNNFKDQPVHIGITGRAGVGKSSLINTLRDLKPSALGAAKVGVTEMTKDRTPYRHLKYDNITFWDIPGISTINFPRNTYINRMKMQNYDAVIICNSERFGEDDVWIATIAKEYKIPFYFVRTKIDQDICNDKDDDPDHDETEMIDKIRSEISNNLNKQGLDNDTIYILSTKLKHVTKWDCPRLIKDLIDNAPGKNRKALIFAMVASSKDVIKLKKAQLMQQIPLVVCEIMTKENKGDRLTSELDRYMEQFGLTKDAMEKHGVKTEDIKKLLKSLEASKTNYLRILAMAGIGVALVLTVGGPIVAVKMAATATATAAKTAAAAKLATAAKVAAAATKVAATVGGKVIIAKVTGAAISALGLGIGVASGIALTSPDNVTLETAEQLSGVYNIDDVKTACKNILKGKIDLENQPDMLAAIIKIGKILVDALDKYEKLAEDVLNMIK